MVFKIPKSQSGLTGYGFDLILPVELNDIKIERVLIRLMERVVRGGRISRHKTQPDKYEEYLDKLLALESMSDFKGDAGRQVLDGWLRNSIVRMGTVGLQRKGIQMDYLRPLTVATFRSGLPKYSWYFRKVDSTIYRVLVSAMLERRSTSDLGEGQNALNKLFLQNLGFGIELGPMPHIDPHYDDANSPQIDVNELLQLRFLEVFERGSDTAKELEKRVEAVPSAIEPIGNDLISLFEKFGASGEKWAAPELVASATAMISYRMFQLPLVLAKACEATLINRDKAYEGDHIRFEPFEIYCDLTQDPSGLSRGLAKKCVARDLESVRRFFIDRVTLRTLADASFLVDQHENIMAMQPQLALKSLGAIQDNPEIEIACRVKYIEIKKQILEVPENVDYKEYFQTLEAQEISWLAKLVDVQVTAQNEQAMMQQVKWFWSTGGLRAGGKAGRESFALLQGNGYRPNWAYAPSDELLTVLLTMVFVDEDLDQPMAKALSLGEVLSRLHDRFGILISQPPQDMDSAEHRLAASENLIAFMNKLRQLGCYRGLTDDLNAQYVERPRSKS
jgi:hypothetical protein